MEGCDISGFDWFRSDFKQIVKKQETAPPQRPPINIPLPIPETENIYPYRYTSAGPSEHNRSKTQWDIRRQILKCGAEEKPKAKAEWMNITQKKGYETSTLTAMLKPFHTPLSVKEFVSTRIPPSLLEPIFVPFREKTNFDKIVLKSIRPNWKEDILYRRRFFYHMRMEDEAPPEWQS